MLCKVYGPQMIQHCASNTPTVCPLLCNRQRPKIGQLCAPCCCVCAKHWNRTDVKREVPTVTKTPWVGAVIIFMAGPHTILSFCNTRADEKVENVDDVEDDIE